MGNLFWKKYSFLSRIHTTRLKIGIAKILYFVVVPFLKTNCKHITRNGIHYNVDLSEGIDLSLFLFGNFQKHILNNALFSLPKDAVVFDVGANFGILSLQFAKAAPFGKVYAFEPTHYAFKKLKQNLKLNPQLAKKIIPIQSFISVKTYKNPNMTAFSSWKVDGRQEEKIHPVHLGTRKSTQGIGAVSLDDFCKREKIDGVDFIKTDTDGYEHEVLKGAEKTIAKYKPVVIFEVGEYLLKEKNMNFVYFLNYFSKYKYFLFDIESKIKITRQNYHMIIPKYSTIDIIAIPR